MNGPTDMDFASIQHLHTVLRNLPHRQAPTQLSVQVLQRLQRQTQAPWWQQRFQQWPISARTLLMSICFAALYLVTTWDLGRLSLWAMRLHSMQILTPLSRLANPLETLLSWQRVMLHVLEKLPMHWLISIGSVLSTLYLCSILLVALVIQHISHTRSIGQHP